MNRDLIPKALSAQAVSQLAVFGGKVLSNRLWMRRLTAVLILSAGSAAHAQSAFDQDVVIQNVTLISPERLTPLLHAAACHRELIRCELEITTAYSLR
jgi:hypothetical protein